MNIDFVFPISSPATKADTPSTLFSPLRRPTPSDPENLIDLCLHHMLLPLSCARPAPGAANPHFITRQASLISLWATTSYLLGDLPTS